MDQCKYDEINTTVDQRDLVVRQLTECQSELYAYIYSLVVNADAAWDILQDANRTLWRKADEYDPDLDFLPWARAHAFNQVRTARKKYQRERLVFKESATLNELAEHWHDRPLNPPGDRTIALERCLEQLPKRSRSIVDQFYSAGKSLAEIAASENRRENTIAVTLHRIRQTLADCIRARLETS